MRKRADASAETTATYNDPTTAATTKRPANDDRPEADFYGKVLKTGKKLLLLQTHNMG